MKFESIRVEEFSAYPGSVINEAVLEVCEFLSKSKQSSVVFKFNGTELKVYRDYDPETVLEMYWEARGL